MHLTRRAFSQRALAMAACSIIALPLTGCPSQQTIAQLTQTIGTTSAALVSALGDTALAATIQTSTTAAVKAITNWTSGSSVTLAIEALNLLMANINLIPAASPYEGLIVIVIGGIEGVLSLIQAQTATPAAAPAVRPAAAGGLQARVKVPIAPLDPKSFQKAYNAEIKLHPELALAPIH